MREFIFQKSPRITNPTYKGYKSNNIRHCYVKNTFITYYSKDNLESTYLLILS